MKGTISRITFEVPAIRGVAGRRYEGVLRKAPPGDGVTIRGTWYSRVPADLRWGTRPLEQGPYNFAAIGHPAPE
jgi:hypothetical protein